MPVLLKEATDDRMLAFISSWVLVERHVLEDECSVLASMRAGGGANRLSVLASLTSNISFSWF